MSEIDLSGKTCLVTGATSGIGEETALAFARMGARVGILARNAEKADATRSRIITARPGSDVQIFICDLGSLDSIRKAAEEIIGSYEAIHILVNNAGLIELSRRTTVDGFETTFGVNHLGPFLLTNLLLPRIEAAAPSRIVNVASDAHRFARRGLDLDDLQNEKAYGAFRVYGESKLANILFTRELARRLEAKGVTVNAVHPGAVATGLGNNNGLFARVVTRILSPLFRTPRQGAETSIHVATAPELAHTTGRYFANSREQRPASQARDDAMAAALWKKSEELVGLEPS